jgi:hypothetical protein
MGRVIVSIEESRFSRTSLCGGRFPKRPSSPVTAPGVGISTQGWRTPHETQEGSTVETKAAKEVEREGWWLSTVGFFKVFAFESA